MPAMFPDRTAKLQPNGWIVAVSGDGGGICYPAKPRISGDRRTLADNGGALSNRIHTHEVAGSSPAPPTNPHLEAVKLLVIGGNGDLVRGRESG